MITTPIPRTRRTKEQIEADQRERVSLATEISAIIAEHYEALKEAEPNADGYRVATISIGFPMTKDGKPFVGINYRPAPISVTRCCLLDDGQDSLPLGDGVGAPPAPGAPGEASTAGNTPGGTATGQPSDVPSVDTVAGPAKKGGETATKKK